MEKFMKNFTKKLRSLKTKQLIVFVIIAIIATILETRAIGTTITYGTYSLKIKLIESEANKGYWTKNGISSWTPEEIEKYNEAQKQKSNFIKNNDFATFLSCCYCSNTGKVFRILLIITLPIFLLVSIILLLAIAKILSRRFNRYAKRLKRYYQKTTSQKTQG